MVGFGKYDAVFLIRQAGQEDGFWKTLGDGIENLQIEDGRVIISLKE